MCHGHGLATELHLNLQIKVIAGCDKDPLLRQLFIRYNKTCKYSYGEMREMIRDILWTLTYPHNSNYALTRISNYSNYSNYSN